MWKIGSKILIIYNTISYVQIRLPNLKYFYKLVMHLMTDCARYQVWRTRDKVDNNHSLMDTSIADKEQCATRAHIQRYATLYSYCYCSSGRLIVYYQGALSYFYSNWWRLGYELLSGHPSCIHYELGVSHDVTDMDTITDTSATLYIVPLFTLFTFRLLPFYHHHSTSTLLFHNRKRSSVLGWTKGMSSLCNTLHMMLCSSDFRASGHGTW